MFDVEYISLETKMLREYLNLLRIPSRIISAIFAIIAIVIGSTFEGTCQLVGVSLGKTATIAMSSILQLVGWILVIFTFNEVVLPIKKEEVKRFIHLSIMFAIIIFMYTSVRQVKDSMLWPLAEEAGIAIAKSFIPIFAYLFSVYYVWMSEKRKVSDLIYIAVIPIMIYFVIFNFFLYGKESFSIFGKTIPFKLSAETIAAKKAFFIETGIQEKAAELIKNGINEGTEAFTTAIEAFKKQPGFIVNSKITLMVLFGDWPITVFYVLAEVFANSVLSVGAWQVINSQLLTKSESQRTVPALSLIVQIPTFVAGVFFKILNSFFKDSSGAQNSYSPILNATTIVLFILTIGLFINNYLFFKSDVSVDNFISAVKKKKTAINVDDKTKSRTWFEAIYENRYYILISGLTVAYGLTTSMLEGFFKSLIKELSKTPEVIKSVLSLDNFNGEVTADLSSKAYSAMNGAQITRQSIMSFVFIIFITPMLVKYTSWKTFAEVTPSSALIGSILLFGLPLISAYTGGTFLGFEVIHIMPLVGGYVVGIFKTLKYGGADVTKNLLINKLTFQQKNLVAKYDGNLSRIGKSGASSVMGICALITGLKYTEPAFVKGFFIFGILCSVSWIYAVIYLDKHCDEVVERGIKEEKALAESNPQPQAVKVN